MRILVTGASGFIGRHLLAALPDAAPVPHQAIPDVPLEGVELVIHAGRAAGIGTEAWRLADDVEHLLLTRLARHPAHYVMLSSRAVYGPAEGRRLRESDLPAPASAYGRNKLRLEQAGQVLLGQRLCILRLSNVFGFEWPGRSTFFGAMLDRLKREGLIRFDMAGSTRRDFVPVAQAAAMIAALATRRRGGIVHVGAGRSLHCAALAEAVIAGYGEGRLVVDAVNPYDEFAYNTALAQARTGINVSEAEILAAARAAGAALRAAE
ncbi:NAD-dependent epimerase/dehydratase family protein [Geminicoccus roseus]|uniref:NAD-dependent epimerase/dehydratase family protein n=1 Tax=Geminicoccus roseus TaxID=404900 RepID=UPI00041655F3|nr:NAD(P)-dependent oxidoreductase [Geminicoccus roseus]